MYIFILYCRIGYYRSRLDKNAFCCLASSGPSNGNDGVAVYYFPFRNGAVCMYVRILYILENFYLLSFSVFVYKFAVIMLPRS